MTLEELLALPERFVDYGGPRGPKVKLAWACTSLCNAACPYCCTAGGRKSEGRSLPMPADEYARIMLEVGEKIGPCYMVTGWGEGLVNEEVSAYHRTIRITDSD